MRRAELALRMRKVIDLAAMSQKDFASSLGYSPGYINDILQGRTGPSSEVLFRLNREFRISADWLLTGCGSWFVKGEKSEQPPVIIVEGLRKGLGDVHKEDYRFTVIPCLSNEVAARLSAGLADVDDCEPIDYFIVPRRWINNPKTTFCLKVVDNSMGPTLQSGGVVAINSSIKTPLRLMNKLCAVRVSSRVVIRRLCVTKTHLIFVPENQTKSVQPFCIDINTKGDSHIIGKVEWVYNAFE